jgi:hypothetical protein
LLPGDLQDVLVGQHVELLTHVLQSHVHLQEVALSTHQDTLELFNQVLPLLEEQAQGAQRGAEELIVLVDGQLEEGKHHGVEGGDVLFGSTLEEVPVLAHVLDVGGVVLEGSQFLELVAPDVDLQHDVLVLTYFRQIVPQNGLELVFVELPTSIFVPAAFVLTIYFRFLLLLVVLVEVLSSFVEPLEEVHHVSESDVDL